MQKMFLITALSLFSYASNAQSLAGDGCGTVTTQEEMQAIYDFVQSNNAVKHKTTTTVDSIPLTIHIVSKDDGTGGYPLQNLFPLICNLNTRYAPVSMYFYIAWPIRFISNSSYYQHDFSTGYQMMQSNHVGQTTNVYLVEDPAGTCGYFSPGADGVAIGKKCAAVNSTTLVHELGHYFGLPHTFYGWENGNTPTMSKQELVRRGVGANCTTAGDGFCDTDADYLYNRWSCPYNGFNVLLDQTGDTLKPDPTLYMSYSDDACMTRFSTLQIGAMRNNLYNKRNYLRTKTATPYAAMSVPTVINPVNNMIYSNTKWISWNNVPGAEYYYVKITSAALPTVIRQEALTNNTYMNITMPLSAGANYLVTIVPLNGKNVCGTNTIGYPFSYSTALGVEDATAKDNKILVQPNPIINQASISITTLKKGNYSLQVYNMAGQLMQQQPEHHQGGSLNSTINMASFPNGVYTLAIVGEGFKAVEKMIVQH